MSKNLYALDTNGSLIHIRKVDKNLNERFKCCNCEGELIAKKGEIKAHHFSHKAQHNCSYESYLHKLAKLKFYNTYLDCLIQKQPFYIDYRIERICKSCMEIENIEIECKLSDEINSFDLTTYFDEISIEKKVGSYIGDIVLSSSQKNDKLLIEFFVTHKCTVEKLSSGLRIIEIHLTDDKDLDFLDSKSISVKTTHASCFNFQSNLKSGNLINPKKCIEKFELFSVLHNNKARKTEKTMSSIMFNIESNRYKYFKILERTPQGYSGEDFIRLVQDYAQKDRSFKNCYSCRFVTKNNSRHAYYDLFCKRMRWEMPNSNTGSDCPKYWKI